VSRAEGRAARGRGALALAACFAALAWLCCFVCPASAIQEEAHTPGQAARQADSQPGGQVAPSKLKAVPATPQGQATNQTKTQPKAPAQPDCQPPKKRALAPATAPAKQQARTHSAPQSQPQSQPQAQPLVPRDAKSVTASPAGPGAPPSGQGFERPFSLQASAVLPRKLLSGPHHRVEEAVENDGYMNTYTVRSRYGDYRVTSTALLAVRVDEFAAMAAMDKVQGASEFGRGVWDGGVSVVEGVKNLVLHPVDSVENAASGVGTLFNRAGDSMAGNAASKYEDSTGAKLTGYAATRREYAREFGVDPYSTNQQMLDKLGSVTKAGYAGGLTSMGLKALIPGGIGIAVSSVSGVHWLGSIDLTQPPQELRARNRGKLVEMGVEESAIAAFMDNAEFTPTQQSLLVKALADLGRKSGMSAYVRLASRTANQDQALFRQRMAQMYAGYHRGVGALEGFIPLGELVAARSAKGALVLCYPLDHLRWTENVARQAARARKAAAEREGCPVELWVTGTVSRSVREHLEQAGWTVKEKAGKTLLGESM